MVYADTAGHIGYQAPGDVPIRRTGQGDWPVPGWDPAYEWDDDYIPFDALPSVLDPDDGYVVTANQAIVGEDYPYYIGDSYDLGFRAQRIRELLASDDALTVDDMSQIQMDDHSRARCGDRPAAARRPPADVVLRGGAAPARRTGTSMRTPTRRLLRTSTCSGSQLLEKTFHDELPEQAGDDDDEQPTWPQGGSRWWVVVRDMLEDPRDPFWDDVDTPEVTETRDDILLAAMMEARDELTRIRSRAASDWRWGDLHTLTLRNDHLGSEDSPVDFLFARGDWELGGGPSIVNATWWDARAGFEVTALPSMRMVIPMDDLDAARWINLTGASGHAYNEHYTDQTDLWAEGKTLPWVFSRDAGRVSDR